MSSLSFVTALADEGSRPFSARFSVQARPEPGVMPRVLELFAKRGLVPQRFAGAASAKALSIDVQIAGLGRDTVDYIAGCMRQIVGVEAVLTTSLSGEG